MLLPTTYGRYRSSSSIQVLVEITISYSPQDRLVINHPDTESWGSTRIQDIGLAPPAAWSAGDSSPDYRLERVPVEASLQLDHVLTDPI